MKLPVILDHIEAWGKGLVTKNQISNILQPSCFNIWKFKKNLQKFVTLSSCLILVPPPSVHS